MLVYIFPEKGTKKANVGCFFNTRYLTGTKSVKLLFKLSHGQIYELIEFVSRERSVRLLVPEINLLKDRFIGLSNSGPPSCQAALPNQLLAILVCRNYTSPPKSLFATDFTNYHRLI
jgi:hypothetical protein